MRGFSKAGDKHGHYSSCDIAFFSVPRAFAEVHHQTEIIWRRLNEKSCDKITKFNWLNETTIRCDERIKPQEGADKTDQLLVSAN